MSSTERFDGQGYRVPEGESKDYAVHPTIRKWGETKPPPPTVCVAVEGGIAFATGTNIEHIEIIVWDWDNYKEGDLTLTEKREMLDEAMKNPFAREWFGFEETHDELRKEEVEDAERVEVTTPKRCAHCGEARPGTFFVRAIRGDAGIPSLPNEEIALCESCTRNPDVHVAYLIPPLKRSYDLEEAGDA